MMAFRQLGEHARQLGNAIRRRRGWLHHQCQGCDDELAPHLL
jgi:hypothetical protein